MKKFLIAIILAVTTLPAFAETHLVFPIGSYHFNRDSNFCEFNPGMAVRHFVDDNKFLYAGVFRNSPCNTSVNIFAGWESGNRKLTGIPYGYGIMGGFTTGYEVPMIAVPYIRLGDRESRFNVQILTLPPVVMGIGITFRIGK